MEVEVRRFWNRRVLAPFRRALVEVPWFGPVVSALLVTMLVDLLTEALTKWGGLWMGWGTVLLLSVVTLIFVYAYTLNESRRRRRGLGPIAGQLNPPKSRGLIFLFSRKETLREAIDHHRPTLAHCWLLVTPEMQDRAANAIQHLPGVSFTLHSLEDRYDCYGCYRTVADIYDDEAPRRGIAPRQVVSDITGGTKPMTMGMIVACLEGNYPIEYVPTAYDAAGQPAGPLPPIQMVLRQMGEGDAPASETQTA